MSDLLERLVLSYQAHLKQKKIPTPKLHAVLGSGIGSNLQDDWIPSHWKAIDEFFFHDLPGMPGASAPGHKGTYRFFQNQKTKSIFTLQVGRLHGYEGLSAKQASLSVLVPRLAGTEKFILSNAAGGLKKEWPVGSVMVIRDHVNLTGQNPLIGEIDQYPKGHFTGPRFPDLADAWNPEFSKIIFDSLQNSSLNTYEGVYLGLLGPSFETPAEIRLFSQWGMGTVGMSTVWEAIALAHSGATVGGFSLISNLGCGLDPTLKLDHFAILEQSKSAAEKIIRALFKVADSTP